MHQLKHYLTEGDCLDMAQRKTFFLVPSIGNHAVAYSDTYLPKSNYICISRNEILHFFNPLDEKRRPFARVLRKYLCNPGLLFSLEKEIDAALARFKKTACPVICRPSNAQLFEQFSNYLQAQYWAFRGIGVLRKIDCAMLNFLRDKAGYLKPEDIVALSYPSQNTAVIQEHKAILRAALKYRKNHSALEGLSDRLFQAFAPITMSWHNEQPRPRHYYRNEIRRWSTRNVTRELNTINAEQKRYLGLRQQAAKKVQCRHRPLLTLLPAFPYLKDKIKIVVNWANYLFLPYLMSMSRRFNISTEDMRRMGVEEIQAMLKGGVVPRTEIAKRKKLFVFYAYHSRPEVLYGREAERFIKHFYPPAQHRLTGRSVSPGKVVGRVVVVKSQDDFRRFSKGAIMVVNNTTPDYVPYMRQAAAIIAEEGGITAHVGIVSRELHVPCIVGMHRAMQVFKNGERIEVDATKGIVRKL